MPCRYHPFHWAKHLAHFSLMKSLIRSYLPPINNLATCDPTGIQHTLCAVQHRSGQTPSPCWHCPPRAAAGMGLLDRAALTKCFVPVTLPGIRRKWVRALPHTSGVWITLTCTLGKYLHSVIVEGLMHCPTVLFFAVPSRLNWKKSHHTEPLRKGNTLNTDLILAR